MQKLVLRDGAAVVMNLITCSLVLWNWFVERMWKSESELELNGLVWWEFHKQK